MTLRRIALAIALAVLAGPAAALGLGQIQVKSKVDQPLLAEIPIVSGDPAELEQLQARLASPETFRRIGLEPPSGAAADLQFTVALDDRGRPVIRVTSTAPVSQPLVTFLVEVDWGSGRLVREYSALLDTPRTVAAPAQPPIQAPSVAPSNVIERPVAAAPQPAAQPEPPPPADAAPAEPAPADADAVATQPEPAPVAAPADTPAPTPADRIAVRDGQTLSGIAEQVVQRGYTLDQTMLALLRANPDAFIKGNVNLLKSGAVLRVPPAQDAAQLAPAEAAAVVRDHLEQWRALAAPAPQPANVAAEASPANTAKTAGTAANGAGTPSDGRRVAGARLEIVPPVDGGAKTPGSRSGASAGGEGDMLRQQELNQTKEDLAARDAEVQELKSRVAELEKLQQDQSALIAMKDSKLAAAEQRLAQSNAAAAKVDTTATTASTGEKPAQPTTPAWLWGGAGLLVLGVLAWLFTRRRSTPRAEPRRVYDTEALAAGIPTSDDVAPRVAEKRVVPEETPTFSEPAPRAKASTPHWTSAPAALGTAPTWHGGAQSDDNTAVAEPQTAKQQLELARAYLDMGDDDAARVILRDVLDGRDPAARDTAARMLREL
ncbi:type IV pilus assembly protein FimV [Noviluteimonas gilva]|uniref:Ferrous iron transporter B n=1 Tax=Noviluteimonas gilva TaxID=2682097 RepID=A0A7C9HW91_9GAMM|nr:FimV/HubP family polar landmark protein [Lysobacter gilvus]MUV15058.1 ferrous iron transporter B [Lysobacter gilvus]